MVSVFGRMNDNSVVCPRCNSLLAYDKDDMNTADKNGNVIFYQVHCPVCDRDIIVDVEDIRNGEQL